ncbi:hypothetical protein T484DRAFT_1789989 [Baffinella frigidus]|nr:hypothetical protein T484DRAFT_1789989 [Cryptophyta sp. CCMP2293]
MDAGRVYLCPKTDQEEALALCSLWRIEKEEVFDGSILTFGGGCRLRHLATNQYLAVRQVREEEAIALSFEAVPQTLLTTLAVRGNNEDRRLVSGSLIYLQARDCQLYVT